MKVIYHIDIREVIKGDDNQDSVRQHKDGYELAVRQYVANNLNVNPDSVTVKIQVEEDQ